MGDSSRGGSSHRDKSNCSQSVTSAMWLATIAMRSMRLSSSRMLPGHGWRSRGPLKLGDEQAFRRRLVEMFPQMGNGEIHNVLEPLPEWREAQREHVEAVKEVRPEPFLCHKLAEILMRGA